MPNIVVIPINSSDERYVFNKSIQTQVPIERIEFLLFGKLFDAVRASHPTQALSIWGFTRGDRSSNANKWNRILKFDTGVFTQNMRVIGVASIIEKFQSENFAESMWPDTDSQDSRLYVITFDSYRPLDSIESAVITKYLIHARTDLERFNLIEEPVSTAALSTIGEKIVTAAYVDPTSEGEPSPEYEYVMQIIEAAAGDQIDLRSRGQGFGLTPEERKAVERRAVDLAIKHFRDLGYTTIHDVGDFESYDLHVKGPLGELFVEIKGTTSDGESIILTRNEVALHKKVFPRNALFVVTNIVLVKSETPIATGGKVQALSPWMISDEGLIPLGYEYRLGSSQSTIES